MNSPTLYGQIQSFSCDSFYVADRMGLDGIMLHYLAVWKVVVSVHRPVHSKITLTYSLTWQTDRCSPRRMAFKVLLNAKALLKFSLHFLFKKNLPEQAPTKTQLRLLLITDQLVREWVHRRSAYAQ